MLLYNITLINIFMALIYVPSSNGEIISDVEVQQISGDANLINDDNEQLHPTADIVHVQLYYECLCYYCKVFKTTKFKNVVQNLSQYVNISTYPYGNARTTVDENGKYKFQCQHGPNECYGNMLHACALNIIKNHTQALLYNSCMMDFSDGSNDNAANKCGESMKIDSESIKACAKSDMGENLLKHYGDESKKADIHHVPYIIVNGKKSDSSNFMKDICAAFGSPPPPCASFN